MGMALPPFQAFLDEHREHVYRFLLSSVGRDEVDDCFQETLLAALRAYPRLRNGSNLRGWVLTIAHRKALDSHRARGRREVLMPEPAAGIAARNGYDDESPWDEVRRLPGKQRAASFYGKIPAPRPLHGGIRKREVAINKREQANAKTV